MANPTTRRNRDGQARQRRLATGRPRRLLGQGIETGVIHELTRVDHAHGGAGIDCLEDDIARQHQRDRRIDLERAVSELGIAGTENL